MQVLLTFTGFHDPFSPTVVERARHVGPVLSILDSLPFDAVYLFDTPGAHDNLDLSKRFGVRISIPPRRERRGDILKLATFALDRWNRLYGESRRLSRDALEQLQVYPWPGNVRELFSAVKTSAMMAHSRILKAKDLKFDEPIWDETPEHMLPEPHEGFSLKEYLNNARDALIRRALDLSHGNRSQAGRLLGITPQAVHRYVKETGI